MHHRHHHAVLSLSGCKVCKRMKVVVVMMLVGRKGKGTFHKRSFCLAEVDEKVKNRTNDVSLLLIYRKLVTRPHACIHNHTANCPMYTT